MAKGQLIIFHTGGTIVSQIEEIEGAKELFLNRILEIFKNQN